MTDAQGPSEPPPNDPDAWVRTHRATYERMAVDYARRIDDYAAADEAERFTRLAAPTPHVGPRILDAGCGPGRDAALLRLAGAEVARPGHSPRHAASSPLKSTTPAFSARATSAACPSPQTVFRRRLVLRRPRPPAAHRHPPRPNRIPPRPGPRLALPRRPPGLRHPRYLVGRLPPPLLHRPHPGNPHHRPPHRQLHHPPPNHPPHPHPNPLAPNHRQGRLGVPQSFSQASFGSSRRRPIQRGAQAGLQTHGVPTRAAARRGC